MCVCLFVSIHWIVLLGFYWGYQVRKAQSIRTIIENCPFDDDAKYDLVIGTSERGTSHDKISEFPRFQHALIVFGGLQGLEKAVEREEGHITSEQLFHYYINTCPKQGSRTIRTEEAILITLSCLREKLLTAAIV
jgi:predicted SPOUT superfamily RNA methylase MTH1